MKFGIQSRSSSSIIIVIFEIVHLPDFKNVARKGGGQKNKKVNKKYVNYMGGFQIPPNIYYGTFCETTGLNPQTKQLTE